MAPDTAARRRARWRLTGKLAVSIVVAAASGLAIFGVVLAAPLTALATGALLIFVHLARAAVEDYRSEVRRG